MSRAIVASIAAGLLVAGCAADSSIIENALVLRSGYDPLTCPQIVAKYKAADGEVQRLTALMEKSGSEVANALAYKSEYTSARANKRFAEEAAARKGCDLGNKPPAPPPAAASVPPPAGAPLTLTPTAQTESKKP
ncbi:MAG TPA: hypothetical protein VK438_05780 [Xanthobacteraceae bacterium]|nr:hypothetical protein [Xanthobacteraceae bacterium]